MNLQPTLENEIVRLVPLNETDFEKLFAVASDPQIWEQHPNKDRYKREVFEIFFEGAIASKGAYLITETKTGNVIGCTRFYDFNADTKTVLIGYTFLAKAYWGSTYNHAVKKLMIDHAFDFVDHIQFHIGANNLRSQISIQRLGAIKTGESDIAYYGEQKKLNFIFQIDRGDWGG